VTPRANAIAAAFKAACLDELEAPKPGNVHRFAAGHRMTADDFVRSAGAAAEPLARPGTRVGARINAAVEATFAAVGVNTNLGIVLLCAPLAAACDVPASDLRAAVAGVLARLDVADADLAFRAIAHAAPAGLGVSERYDVADPATVGLKAAMQEAAGRDRIARQYITDFEDVFEIGEPVLAEMLAQESKLKWATLAVYLEFLSEFPDTHIIRKHGSAVAEETRVAARSFRERLQRSAQPNDVVPELLAWDAALKRCEINPGTSADLTVAALFAHRLRTILPPQSNSD
jgi:triphosphoribosyl-dephospho-CoA synthase